MRDCHFAILTTSWRPTEWSLAAHFSGVIASPARGASGVASCARLVRALNLKPDIRVFRKFGNQSDSASPLDAGNSWSIASE